MTRKQMILIIMINAVISGVISVVVALLMIRPADVVSSSTPTALSATTATAALVLEPTAEAPEAVAHVVVSGDTISGLAFEYNVPEEDIIAANRLANPNFLQVGMELIIPVGGLPDVTATFTPAPTATDTPIPFNPPSANMTATAAAEAGATATPLPTPLPSEGTLAIEIREILDAGQRDQERVVLFNAGERLADMDGWTLSDSEGDVYEFPNFRLWAGGSVIVHTGSGMDGSPPSNFYWDNPEAVWFAGKVATLRDAEGNVVARYTVGP
jgi:LysM repeat protein